MTPRDAILVGGDVAVEGGGGVLAPRLPEVLLPDLQRLLCGGVAERWGPRTKSLQL